MRRNVSRTLPPGRSSNPMRDHDRLPPPLRLWATQALRPWCPRSLRRAFERALARTGSVEAALRRLEACEAATLAREGRRLRRGSAIRPR
jgi:hypothetical protein